MFSEELVARKDSALRVLRAMVAHFDRETFLRVAIEIESALQATLMLDEQNSPGKWLFCRCILTLNGLF